MNEPQGTGFPLDGWSVLFFILKSQTGIPVKIMNLGGIIHFF
jgi:hypothetical protein